MDRMLVVSLPVRDLATSRAFYTRLGLTVNEAFTDPQVVCVVVSRSVFVMLVRQDRFAQVAGVGVGAVPTEAAGLHCLSVPSRDEVDALVEAVRDVGGREVRPAQEDASMYARTVADPDGHVWELLHADLPVG